MESNIKKSTILILSSTIILLVTLIFIVAENYDTEYFLKGADVFFTLFIVLTIVLGISFKRKVLREKILRIKSIIVFMLVTGVSIFSLYIYYVIKVESLHTLSLDRVMTLIIAIISLILLVKICYDIENNVA
jgi:hypothetical protein